MRYYINGDFMKNISKYKVDKGILITLIIFAIISILTIYSAQNLLTSDMQNLYLKQILWYSIGFVLAYLIMFIGNDIIIKKINILYIIGIVLLFLVLIFGSTINEAKCWFVLPGFGNFQPSEFMKIILIIMLAKMIDKFHLEHGNPSSMEEFKFLIKVLFIVAIPSFLTFLEPDTGVVLIYLLITFVMLFISGFRYRWFLIVIGLIVIGIGSLLAIYFFNKDLFINIFGTSFFLRIDRLLDWSNGSGYQLENGMTAIASGGLFGNGFNNTPIYFPEPQTDFIFSIISEEFGFLGVVIVAILFLTIIISCFNICHKTNNLFAKYLSFGITFQFSFQTLLNLMVVVGLIPVTGVTLPFLSYGGSSLLITMLSMGIILNISRYNS